MSWLNSDSYDKGFNAGKADAIAGKKRNVLSMKAGLKSVVAFNNNVFQDTYIRGYKEGYRTGLTLKSVKKEFNPKKNKERNKLNVKNSTMQRGIDGQIDLLEQMKDFLSNLSEQFEEVIRTQEGFIRGLDSEGLDFKLLETFEDYLEENRNKIRGLIDGIENEEIPYTERVIRHLEDTPR